jgi:hypothetical protein
MKRPTIARGFIESRDYSSERKNPPYIQQAFREQLNHPDASRLEEVPNKPAFWMAVQPACKGHDIWSKQAAASAQKAIGISWQGDASWCQA